MQNNFLLKNRFVLYCQKHKVILKKLMCFHDSSKPPFVRLPDLTVSEIRNQRITILCFGKDYEVSHSMNSVLCFAEMGKAALKE